MHTREDRLLVRDSLAHDARLLRERAAHRRRPRDLRVERRERGLEREALPLQLMIDAHDELLDAEAHHALGATSRGLAVFLLDLREHRRERAIAVFALRALLLPATRAA